MKKTIETQKFVCVDVDKNSNKFWTIHLHDDGVTTEWGRITGSQVHAQQSKFFPHSSPKRLFEKKITSKLKKRKDGTQYMKVDDVLVPKLSSVVCDTKCSYTKDLVEHLTQVDRHKVLDNTNISYDGVSFTTPLGPVSQSTIDSARSTLSQLQTTPTNELINKYLMLIPRDMGRRIPANLFVSSKDFQRETELLDALESSIVSVSVSPTTFELELSLVEDTEKLDDIHRQFNDTRKSCHVSSALKIGNVWSVIIKVMNDGWAKNGALMENIWRLWHGTSSSNLLSIFKHGLIIPKNYSNGRAFGDGLYFSRESTKSLNYSYGYWGGTYSRRCFMFLADVAMGKYFTPQTTTGARRVPEGHDSIYAQPGISGVLHSEMIVPNTNQANLVYLVEFNA